MDAFLIGLSLACAIGAGVRFMVSTGRRPRFPAVTLALAGFTLAVSIAGNLDQVTLHSLDRSRDQLLSGEIWRLASPLFVQDGGWAGTAFNIGALLFIGTLTETVFGGLTLLGAYFTAGTVSEIAAYTVLQNQGSAGNSVAVLGLAGLCLVTFAARERGPTRALGVLGLAAGSILLITANLHGVGFATGVILGIVLLRQGRRTGSA